MTLEQRAVLVVDDEPVMREYAADALAHRGLEIVEAADADQALAALAAHPEIGVLFTDIAMPGRLNGCDLAREVHVRRPDISVVMTSGQSIPDDWEIPPEAIFIAKPYSLNAVADMIAGLLA